MSGTSSTSFSTMTRRIYSSIPRISAQAGPSMALVRNPSRTLYSSSSPVLSFFDSPPPHLAPSRPGNVPVLSTQRLPAEGRGEQPGHSSIPLSLAFAAPSKDSFSTSPPTITQNYHTNPKPYAHPLSSADVPVHRKHHHRYTLDIGAYGIPKRAKTLPPPNGIPSWRSLSTQSYDGANLAVQIGEDAYFVRDNALGVADGVGGWSKSRHSSSCPTPSALFSKRLMHYCSAEVADQTCKASTSASHPTIHGWPWSDPDPTDLDLEECLEHNLEELEEGIDVLMILERAYQRTLDAHVIPPPSHNSSEPISIPIHQSTAHPREQHSCPCTPPDQFLSSNSRPSSFSFFSGREPGPEPLLEGSSTALLAVLDYIPKATVSTQTQANLDSSGVSACEQNSVNTDAYTAVIKIAHVGDCMGMLIRGNEIVWRSEEMWWCFNTPVQLGPPPAPQSNKVPVTPWNSAHTFTLPVQPNDILILASDGLSDNLWDEDILDEVIRMRGTWCCSFPTSLTEDPVEPSERQEASQQVPSSTSLLWRRTLAGMLSEALCSRARHVSERKGGGFGPSPVSNIHAAGRPQPESVTSMLEAAAKRMEGSVSASQNGTDSGSTSRSETSEVENDIPFARRAKEELGRDFRGGKRDDISVLVAVISPVDGMAQHHHRI